MAISNPNTHVLVTFEGAAATPEDVWRLIADFRASMVIWQCDVLAYLEPSSGPVLRTMTFGTFPPVSEAKVVCDAGTKTMQYDGWDTAKGTGTGYQSQMTVGVANGNTTIDWLAHSIGANGVADNIQFHTKAANSIASYFGVKVSVQTLPPK